MDGRYGRGADGSVKAVASASLICADDSGKGADFYGEIFECSDRMQVGGYLRIPVQLVTDSGLGLDRSLVVTSAE
ncbi:hypothetical protein DWU98_09725 [Dyella monticola]|uniref:Uncharacterized protein n=1 Tax=Dyella monticola TaxID=1927958 RepID=A0A370X1K6_9GAMM|nr:hypothetical protein DWU98_09725 [Dyella monticola]